MQGEAPWSAASPATPAPHAQPARAPRAPRCRSPARPSPRPARRRAAGELKHRARAAARSGTAQCRRSAQHNHAQAAFLQAVKRALALRYGNQGLRTAGHMQSISLPKRQRPRTSPSSRRPAAGRNLQVTVAEAKAGGRSRTTRVTAAEPQASTQLASLSSTRPASNAGSQAPGAGALLCCAPPSPPLVPCGASSQARK